MNTLKEILVDAARYRWLREGVCPLAHAIGFGHFTPEFIDKTVDESMNTEISKDE